MQLIYPTSGHRNTSWARPPALGRGRNAASATCPRTPISTTTSRRRSCSNTSPASSATTPPSAPSARGAAARRRSGIGAERRLQLRKFSKGMLQRVGIAQALLNDREVGVLRRADVGARPARPARDSAADSAAPRSRVHRVLQLARALRRRGAVQSRRDCGARPAGGVGPALGRSSRSRCTAGSW